MGVVMIRCPKTEKAIFTGMHIDSAAFYSMPVFFSNSFCPSCGTSHEWFARNEWICESGTEICDADCKQQVA
jgi:hypothetical protein